LRLPILVIVLYASGSLAQFNRFPQVQQQPFQQQQFRIPRQQANQNFNNVQRPQAPQRPFQQSSRPFQAMAEQVRQTRQQTLQANGQQQPFKQPTAQPVRNSNYRTSNFGFNFCCCLFCCPLSIPAATGRLIIPPSIESLFRFPFFSK